MFTASGSPVSPGVIDYDAVAEAVDGVHSASPANPERGDQ